MKTKQYIFIILLSICTVFTVKSQNLDAITLKAGAVIKGTLTPQIQDFKTLDKVIITSASGKVKMIPLKAIGKVTLADGAIVFPIPIKTPKKTIALSMYDTIFLKTGFAMPCNLALNGADVSSLEKIPLINKKGVSKQIPKVAIAKIKNKKGEIIFPKGLKEKVVEPIVVEPKKPELNCYKETEQLRREIENYSLDRYNSIKNQISNKTESFVPASYDMEQQVKTKLYDRIKNEIEHLKKMTTSVNALITIKVDKGGKLIEFTDKVLESEYVRNYNVLRDGTIYPYLQKLNFPTNKIAIDYSDEYEKLYAKFKYRIEISKCKDEIEKTLLTEEKRFKSLGKSFVNTNTVYKIPIEFNFNVKTQTWTYFKDKLRIKKRGSNYMTITKEEVKNSFLSKVKFKQKNGKYRVGVNYFKMLDDSLNISVNSVKRKYKYVSHYGVTMQGHYSFGTTSLSPSVGELYTYNAKLIFHKIGFFGGGLLNLSNHKERSIRTSDLDGKFIQKIDPLYIEGGLYVGVGEYFYFKGGIAYLNADFSEYKNSVLINWENKLTAGFTGGMALIFPFFQIEAGYNSIFNSFYAGVGLHITVNE